MTIYAERETPQVLGRDHSLLDTARARRTFADAPAVRPYQSASASSRTRSSHVCRFRISATLSPRTNASAGSGREL